MKVRCCELYCEPTAPAALAYGDLAGLEVLSKRCYRRPESCRELTPRPIGFQLDHVDLGCCELCAGRVVDEMQRLGGPGAFLARVAAAWREREGRRRLYRRRLAGVPEAAEGCGRLVAVDDLGNEINDPAVPTAPAAAEGRTR